jgi:hypothetical protein
MTPNILGLVDLNYAPESTFEQTPPGQSQTFEGAVDYICRLQWV